MKKILQKINNFLLKIRYSLLVKLLAGKKISIITNVTMLGCVYARGDFIITGNYFIASKENNKASIDYVYCEKDGLKKVTEESKTS